jgi:hypothetical protein
MAQAVERRPNQDGCHQDSRCGVSRDSKPSNAIIQLRKIPHSQTKLASHPKGFGVKATSAMRERKATEQGMSTTNLKMQSFGVGKCLNVALVW